MAGISPRDRPESEVYFNTIIYIFKHHPEVIILDACFSRDEDGDKPVKPMEEPVEEWAPWMLVLPTKNPHAPPPVSVKTTPGPAWDIGQVRYILLI